MKKFKGILTIAAVAIGTLALTGCGKTTIDLNDYVTIASEGYDTIGEVWAHFDEDALRADYKEKIKPSKEGMELAETFGEDAIDLMLDNCVDYGFNGSDEAYNGETYEFTWSCASAQAEEYFNVVLKYSDITYTVDNLKELGTFDPFEYINVSFSGTSPAVVASYEVDSSKEEMSYVTVEWMERANQSVIEEANQNLENGEEITLHAYIPNDKIQEFAEKYGALIETDTKTYTCEVDDYYVNDVSQIPEATLNEMIAKGEEAYRAKEANAQSRVAPKGIEEFTYVGNYFLTTTSVSLSGDANYLYLIYHVKEIDYKSELQDFYTSVRFDNILNHADGTCEVNLDNYDIYYRSLDQGSWSAIDGTRDLTDFYTSYICGDLYYTYQHFNYTTTLN